MHTESGLSVPWCISVIVIYNWCKQLTFLATTTTKTVTATNPINAVAVTVTASRCHSFDDDATCCAFASPTLHTSNPTRLLIKTIMFRYMWATHQAEPLNSIPTLTSSQPDCGTSQRILGPRLKPTTSTYNVHPQYFPRFSPQSTDQRNTITDQQYSITGIIITRRHSHTSNNMNETLTF